MDSPRLNKPPTHFVVVKTVFPYLCKPPTHFAVVEMDSLSLYNFATHFAVFKPDAMSLCRPPIHFRDSAGFLTCFSAGQNRHCKLLQVCYSLYGGQNGLS